MDHSEANAVLTAHKIEILGNPNDELALRLRTKLATELESYEREQRERTELHDKYFALAQAERDHYLESEYRRKSARRTDNQLSKEALQEVSDKLKTITDAELKQIFGLGSNATAAGKLAAHNPLLYNALRALAHDKGLI